MSPAYTPEQYERWFVRDCVRCGRRAAKAANWEGPICRTCYARAVRTHGRCPGCGVERLLPGRRDDHAPICRDCAAITRDFFCARCGFEGELHGRRLCTRCTLSARLHPLLDDGTGRVHPPLLPLVDALVGMPSPLTGLKWLRTPTVRRLLTDLATGRAPISHDTLRDLPNPQAVAYLRDLLMTCEILPVVDKQLLHAEALLHGKLAALTDNPHYRLLRQFAQWFQLPRLRRRARRGPVSDAGRHYISTPLDQAERFLSWLDQHGRGLGGCTQADLDLWHADVLDHCKKALRPFLIWAMNAGHMPKLTLPALGTSAGQPITQSRRLALLRRVLTDERPPIRSRVAAALMLLYGQPATRLVRLTVEDVIPDGDQVLIRLGTPPSPVPDPLGGLLLKLVGSRQNMNTVNAGSYWLFPGRLAGQPLHHSTLLSHLRDDLGLPTGATRAATLRQLVLQAPAPVIADALGFSAHHMNRIWTAAGGNWKSYAPGDHSR